MSLLSRQCGKLDVSQPLWFYLFSFLFFAILLVAGVLSNMQQFFDNLRTNLESLEQLPHDNKEELLGQHVASAAGTWPLGHLTT
jgi:hypothetical protein